MNAGLPKLPAAVLLGLVMAAAAGILAQAGRPAHGPGCLGAWFAACLAGEVFWIRTASRGGILSMALALDLAAVFVLGPGSGLPVIAASTLAASVYPHRRIWYRALFNTAHSVVAAGAALLVWRLLSPTSVGLGAVREVWLPLLPAGAAFSLANSGLVALAVAMHDGGSPWRAWRENFGYPQELLSCGAEVLLAGFVIMAYQTTGVVALAAVLPVLAVISLASRREADARAAETPAGTAEERPRLRLAV